MTAIINQLANNQFKMSIQIYPLIYYIWYDLDLHEYVWNIRAEKNVDVITGFEVLDRIRSNLTQQQINQIERWVFERL